MLHQNDLKSLKRHDSIHFFRAGAYYGIRQARLDGMKTYLKERTKMTPARKKKRILAANTKVLQIFKIYKKAVQLDDAICQEWFYSTCK